ncbi:hypothetical protein QR680_010839 [Steinernema hermaphroditum]|uniref:Uncharacterized protein n=1 Tax=Steinernema hermaphroditum TaxID=289476 RepID=A0AA39IRG6_9BILA|nr:hypothetical protein QR680_010839 [Steinernema hermaphroditum]
MGFSDSQMADKERTHDFYWNLAEDHKSSANNLLDHLEHRSLELQAQQALWDGYQSRSESPSPSPMAVAQPTQQGHLRHVRKTPHPRFT